MSVIDDVGWPVPVSDDPLVVEVWRQLENLCVAAGVTDPESAWVKVGNDESWELRVRSTTRGFVLLGPLNYFPLSRIIAGQLEAELEPYRAGAQRARRATKDPKVARARALKADGLSDAAIARRMLAEGLIQSRKDAPEDQLENARRSVQRWLHSAK